MYILQPISVCISMHLPLYQTSIFDAYIHWVTKLRDDHRDNALCNPILAAMRVDSKQFRTFKNYLTRVSRRHWWSKLPRDDWTKRTAYHTGIYIQYIYRYIGILYKIMPTDFSWGKNVLCHLFQYKIFLHCLKPKYQRFRLRFNDTA